MNKFVSISFILFLASIVFIACKPKNTPPEGHLEYHGKFYKEPKPVEYDSDGDGVPDATIEVLGTSLDVTQTPDGKPLYGGTQSPADSGETAIVPTGVKLCYQDLSRNCDSYGGLYAPETAFNTDFSELRTISNSQQIDSDENDVVDYIDEIRNKELPKFIQDNYQTAANQIKTLFEEAVPTKQISSYVVGQKLQQVLETTLTAGLYENDEYIDIEAINQQLLIDIYQVVYDIAEFTEFDVLMSEEELENIAQVVAQDLTSTIVAQLSESLSEKLLDEYTELINTDQIELVQGICPDGYHVPSDREWMIFEKAIGMPIEDLTKSGITITNRGGEEGVVGTMIDDHGFQYSGYMSINGTYAQLGEAGVYISSTVGSDGNGDYVWVRQIDTSFAGVIRYKHYEKSGLSIRCFKD
ncbi:MAG: FISUMP domain-containing protein [Bacteroidota bacterium]